MRKILFRGKSLDTGEWVYGYFANLKWYYDDSYKAIIIPEDGGLYPCCEISGYEFVDPETVSQWTGLVDKNGVKIFEGDVVADSFGLNFVISFENEAFVCLNDLDDIQYTLFEHHEIDYKNDVYLPLDGYYTVVGNKWDNPELID